MTALETDYLVVGAGAMGMAFTDTMRPPAYDVADGVDCVPPNDMPAFAANRERFVVVGAGKTGIDTPAGGSDRADDGPEIHQPLQRTVERRV